jgi:glucose dehydrogenase
MAISVVLAQLGAPCAVNAQAIPGAKAESTKALVQGEWLAYAGTHASARYSPLTQIDRGNAKDLHFA